jgi:hypothetical protein
MTELNELIARWNSDEGKPYKGSLIDMKSYEEGNLSCMCAQGQVLHVVGGWSADRLSGTAQVEADEETARLLNISRAHAVLLRKTNDQIDGAPAIVLTDPSKVIGDQWSKLLDFWWHMDSMTDSDWLKVIAAWDAAGDAAWDAAGDAAWDAAWAAAWDAARDAAWAAAWEIQGAEIFKRDGRAFFFLPMFGFATPDDIPARPADYGVVA